MGAIQGRNQSKNFRVFVAIIFMGVAVYGLSACSGDKKIDKGVKSPCVAADDIPLDLSAPSPCVRRPANRQVI